MNKQLIQEVVGHFIPRYICEILTNNYCDGFLGMNVIKNGDRYIFSYDTGYYRRLERDNLLLPSKLFIIQEVFKIVERNENHLIPLHLYLLEPELIFIRDGSIYGPEVRMMFYPDSNHVNYDRKMIKFLRTLLDMSIPDEFALFTSLEGYIDRRDYNGAHKYLEIKAKKFAANREAI